MTIGSLPIGGDAIGGDAAGGVRIPRRGWYPCCCPSPDMCVVLRDNFDREAIGSDWVVDAGSWSIVDETLRTTSANAQLRHVDIEVPASGGAGFWVRALVSGSTAGDQLEVRLGSFIFRAQLEFQTGAGNGTLRLMQGTDVYCECPVTAEPGETYELGITQHKADFVPVAGSGIMQTIAATLDAVVLCAAGQLLGSPPAGNFNAQPVLSTGTLTGTATFDNVRVSATEGDAVECRRVECCYPFAMSPPAQVRVEIDGLANGESSGCDCADHFEGTYYADLVTDFSGLALDPDHYCAVYRYVFDVPIVCSTRTVEAMYVLIDTNRATTGSVYRLCRQVVMFTEADGSAIALSFGSTAGVDTPCVDAFVSRQALVSGENICDSTNYNIFAPSNPHGTATVRMPA